MRRSYIFTSSCLQYCITIQMKGLSQDAICIIRLFQGFCDHNYQQEHLTWQRYQLCFLCRLRRKIYESLHNATACLHVSLSIQYEINCVSFDGNIFVSYCNDQHHKIMQLSILFGKVHSTRKPGYILRIFCDFRN